MAIYRKVLFIIVVASLLVIKETKSEILPEDVLQPVWDFMETQATQVLKPIQHMVHKFNEQANNKQSKNFDYLKYRLELYIENIDLYILAFITRLETKLGNLDNFVTDDLRDDIILYGQPDYMKEVIKVEKNIDIKLLYFVEALTKLQKSSKDKLLDIKNEISQFFNSEWSTKTRLDFINVDLYNLTLNIIKGKAESCCNQSQNTGMRSDQVSEIINVNQDIADSQKIGIQALQEGINNLVQIQTELFMERHCKDIKDRGVNRTSAVYTIYNKHNHEINTPVYCDLKDHPGDWTVVFRKTSLGGGSFNTSMDDFINGFGEAFLLNFWVGLDWLSSLTSSDDCMLRISVTLENRTQLHADYKYFRVGDSINDYSLEVDGYHGNLSNIFKNTQKSTPFSTYDNDKDDCSDCNCAQDLGGGWWYGACEAETSPTKQTFPNDPIKLKLSDDQNNTVYLIVKDITMKIRYNMV